MHLKMQLRNCIFAQLTGNFTKMTNMRIIAFFVCVSFFALSCNPKRDAHSKKEELINLVTTYYDALARIDTATLKRISTANFVLFDDGEQYNNETAIEMVLQLPAFKARFSFDSVNAYIDEEYASMYYIRNATFSMNDSVFSPLRFLENATFVKEEDDWKIRFIHSSLKKQ